MRTANGFGAAALVFAAVACSHATDLSSGIEVGKKVGAYKATKCAGADDGVEVGKSLCFT